MFSRPGALYAGRVSLPGEVRLRRDRLTVVSYDRQRTVGSIEQDYFFDDVGAVSLTTPSLSRPRRTVRLDLLDGSVEHVWVAEAEDSFAQLEAAFRAYRDDHPAPEGSPPPSRSGNPWAERIGGDGPLVTWPMALAALVALLLNLAPATRDSWLGGVITVGLLVVLALRVRHRRRRRREALLDSAG